MPGLGGAGTLPRLRAILPGVPVLLATGRIGPAAIALSQSQPQVGLLPTPFTLQGLERELQRLDRARG